VGGTIYFDVTRFPAYGALSGNAFSGMLAAAADNVPGKRNPEDFALWKSAEPGREMAWESPWGRGFPGWHIECSAMATHYLGPHIDIHTGGVDNIFPHHENEIAQSEGVLGAPWVACWVHAQHLLTDGLKMSKSASNTYQLDEIVARGFEPLALRMFFAMAHYRTRLNFTFSALHAAQTALRRLRIAAQRCRDKAGAAPDPEAMAPWQAAFDAALDDDLHIPRAMATVWRLIRADGHAIDAASKWALLQEWDAVLGFDLSAAPDTASPPPQEIQERVDTRARLRSRREYAEADRLRDALALEGYRLEDTPDGTRVRRQPLRERVRLFANWREGPDRRLLADRCTWSVNLIAHNNHDDLRRCLQSIARHADDQSIEIVIVDNGSTDETVALLEEFVRRPVLATAAGQQIPVEVFFADHNLGFAGGRNLSMRASRGRYVVWLDTSIQVDGDIWTLLAEALADPSVGVAGPYGLVTGDLREFEEKPGPDVDAIEGYLLAFSRTLLNEIDVLDEKFRFYRLADLYLCFCIKAAGLRAVALPEVAARLTKYPHREWYSLLPEEQATKSKKNYDLFRARWHHGESLLVMNGPTPRWRNHDDPRHIEATHTHTPDELPPPGQPHTHPHRHLADHEHTHPHTHEEVPT
jgi:cysteinyl-tRNA synthetase